jgi:hypothetical protein
MVPPRNLNTHARLSPDDRVLLAVRVLERSIERLDRDDPVAGDALAHELLAFLLGPRGRGVVPRVTGVVACLLARGTPVRPPASRYA